MNRLGQKQNVDRYRKDEALLVSAAGHESHIDLDSISTTATVNLTNAVKQTVKDVDNAISAMFASGEQYTILQRTLDPNINNALSDAARIIPPANLHGHYDSCSQILTAENNAKFVLTSHPGVTYFLLEVENEFACAGIKDEGQIGAILSDMRSVIEGSISVANPYKVNLALRHRRGLPQGRDSREWHFDVPLTTSQDKDDLIVRVLVEYTGPGAWYARVPKEKLPGEFQRLYPNHDSNTDWSVLKLAKRLLNAVVSRFTADPRIPELEQGYKYRGQYEVDRAGTGSIAIHLCHQGEAVPGALHTTPAVAEVVDRMQLLIEMFKPSLIHF